MSGFTRFNRIGREDLSLHINIRKLGLLFFYLGIH